MSTFQPSVSHLKSIASVLSVSEAELNELVMVKIMPYYFRRVMIKNEDAKIKREILREIHKMRHLANER